MLRRAICGLGLALACLLAVLPAAAQLTLPGMAPAAPAAAAATPSPEPTAGPPPAIAVPEVATRAEEAAESLRRIGRVAAARPEIAQISQALPEIAARVEARRDDTAQMLSHAVPLKSLDHLAGSWQTIRGQLLDWNQKLTQEAIDLEQALQDLARRRDQWIATRKEAAASQAPPEVVQRIDATLATIADTQQTLSRRRSEVLVVQSQVASELVQTEQVLSDLAQARIARVGRLFERDCPAIWDIDLGHHTRAELAPRIRDAVEFEIDELREFAWAHRSALVFELLLLLGLSVLFRIARIHMAEWSEDEPTLARTGRVFARPYSSAFALVVLGARILSFQVPRLHDQAIAILGAAPTLRLLVLLPAGLRPAGFAVCGFFLLDQVRDLFAPFPQIEQLLEILELAAAAALFCWVSLSHSRRALDLLDASRLPHARGVTGLAAAILLVGLLASATGFTQLARLLGGAVLASAYIATALYVTVRVCDGLVACALRVRPLDRLRIVERHRRLLERRAHRVLVWLAVGGWVFGLTRVLAVSELIVDWLRGFLETDIAPSGGHLLVGDALGAVLTIWVAFLLSRFIRFVLEEEVYPRVEMPRGIPYAISTVLHYCLIAGAVFLALAALGLDLNRFTILAGAFGIGIGFGLQNIVNNFVSGLILLFERPVQVGDIVEIGDILGEVRRIGVRSSTVRTYQGAEVIVPNGSLISERVTNWTLSDRQRRIDAAVGVAYGTDPDRVLDILRELARSHAGILGDPAPLALFVRFGESSLDFELRCWTNRFDQYALIASELRVGIYRALQEAGIEIPFPQRDLRLRSLPSQEATARGGR